MGERDGGGVAEEQRSVPVPDAPDAGVHLSGESHAAAAPKASLLLAFSCFPYLCSPFLQGMRDVRASPPPVLEDVEQWVVNWAHAEAQKKKKKKDAKEAKRKRKNLEHEELEKRHRQQR